MKVKVREARLALISLARNIARRLQWRAIMGSVFAFFFKRGLPIDNQAIERLLRGALTCYHVIVEPLLR